MISKVDSIHEILGHVSNSTTVDDPIKIVQDAMCFAHEAAHECSAENCKQCLLNDTRIGTFKDIFIEVFNE
jgi:hypothetical protein